MNGKILLVDDEKDNLGLWRVVCGGVAVWRVAGPDRINLLIL